MIEKLKVYGETPSGYKHPENIIQDKINELVDAVNELQTKVNKMAQNLNFAQPDVKENVQDEFAEQRKWVGYFCRFWDTDEDYCYYGLLTKIYDINPYCYECNRRTCYEHCEPIKDDIIYKGE